MTAIETHNISKSFGSTTALSQVSFSVEKGEVIGLLGPNGAGKSTLMRILTGYLQPDAGEARVGGIDVVEDPLAAQRLIGYLPEDAPVYGDMAVQEYLLMIASLRDIEPDKLKRLLSEAIYATGLEDYLTRPIRELSKGYRQRVGIAQAILHKPDLLILDEPTSGLDPTQIVEIRDLIRRLAESATVVLSTHILSEVEMTCDRAVIIIRGQLRSDANVADLKASNSALVAIANEANGVREALSAIDGAQHVAAEDKLGDYTRWRVTSSHADDLCPAIFDVVRKHDWRISELKQAPKTLETVFRELTKRVEVGG